MRVDFFPVNQTYCFDGEVSALFGHFPNVISLMNGS